MLRVYSIGQIRTNNFTDENMMRKITGLWAEAGDILQSIQTVSYAVYHQYESNYQGDYTLSIALEEYSGEECIDLPTTDTYQAFSVDSSDKEGIYKAWKQIWGMEEEGAIQRAYTIDYEKYYPTGEIELWIAIK
ncbi:GyrI-like domain-containing protein [Bacillus sp. 1P06AnD]|uniref:GyrI-like domain-containing protein n=1 Tax=Bacillus sp. 1P06AnD TaxID=3132208 RepID=UPI0039A06ADD